MQPVSGPTLMMAIQAVDAERRRLLAEIAGTDTPEVADLQDLEETFRKAAEELRAAYIRECDQAINLPPYESLLAN